MEGSEKEAAVAAADEKLTKVKRRAGWGLKARLAELRAMFESNKLAGPYFPLARFGSFFATVRNEKGKVLSFSRFETEEDQQAFVGREKEETWQDRVRRPVEQGCGKRRGELERS